MGRQGLISEGFQALIIETARGLVESAYRGRPKRLGARQPSLGRVIVHRSGENQLRTGAHTSGLTKAISRAGIAGKVARGRISPPAVDEERHLVGGNWLEDYMADCRDAVIREIKEMLPRSGRYERVLYRLILDYPLREAKGLRPTLAIATCRALGQSAASVIPTAAVLELFHNAFLIHDDVEDESLIRRGGATLHQAYGVPIAVNVGDAMLCLSLEPLLANVKVVGLGPALQILQAVSEMTRRTVEGQSIELDWVKRGVWNLTEKDYVDMVVQKTGWYTFMTPVRVAAIVAGLDESRTAALVEFARVLSVAFQIQDDVLNLQGEVQEYGKEIGGDLWEGKRTLILLHALRRATGVERTRALRILSLARPRTDVAGARDRSLELITGLLAGDEVTAAGKGLLRAAAAALGNETSGQKTVEDVRDLMTLVSKYRSIDYAAAVARRWSARAQQMLGELSAWIAPSPHRRVIESMVDFVHSRQR